METSSPGVQPRPNSPIPPPQRAFPAAQQLAYARRLAFLVDIVSARALALLGLVGAIGIFGYAIYDPSPLRNWLVALYSVGVLWPLVGLYWRTDKQPQPD